MDNKKVINMYTAPTQKTKNKADSKLKFLNVLAVINNFKYSFKIQYSLKNFYNIIE